MDNKADLQCFISASFDKEGKKEIGEGPWGPPDGGAITFIVTPEKLKKPPPLWFHFTIENAGLQKAEDFFWFAVLTSDWQTPAPLGWSALAGRKGTASLDAGEPLKFSLQLPSWGHGRVTAQLHADFFQSVSETNELNNWAQKRIWMQAGFLA